MRKIVTIALITFITNAHALNDRTICLGKNESKLAIEHSDKLYLTINDQQKFYFNKPYTRPVPLKSQLPTDKVHTVSVYLNSELAKTLHVNFIKLKSTEVTIWRSAGGWKLLTGLDCGV